MSVVTVRNLPEETHRALKLRAAQHGRSTEAEIREILEEAVRPKTRLKIGAELAAFGQLHASWVKGRHSKRIKLSAPGQDIAPHRHRPSAE